MTDLDKPLWEPSAARIANARIGAFQRFIEERTQQQFANYDELWRWSITDLNAFWQGVWDFHGLQSHTPYHYGQPLSRHQMPGAQWFKGATLNFVDQILNKQASTEEASAEEVIVYFDEEGIRTSLSWLTLKQDVASLSQQLRAVGVVKGDRVVGFLPNTPQCIVAFLATASLGAIWSVCSPDMGPISVLDRFQQIEPTVLLACSSYSYGGKSFDRTAVLAQLQDALPSLKATIMVEDFSKLPAQLCIEPVAFDHPLWIVYSSGTTGLPKPIVHGHGGVLLEALVSHLVNDLGPTDKFLWLASTGWIVWNLHMAGLLIGATVCIYNGNPGYPDLLKVWRIVDAEKVTAFGSGAAFYANCLKAGISPRAHFEFAALKSISSTGSPLSEDCYRWVYRHIKQDVWLNSVSGGTDFAGGFITGNCTLPVYAGEMQGRCLGHAVFAFNDQGQAVIDEVGELVCIEPVPSMPLFFWNDKNNQRYQESYFDTFPAPAHAPAVIPWRHGDWIKITPRGGAIIYGRSDATINRYGIRMGTAELYRVVDSFDEVLDSMVVDLEYLGRESYMPLFVVLREGLSLDATLAEKLKAAIRTGLSARHVPNDVFQVPEIPRTLTGKKLELPIKKLLLGQAIEKVSNPGAMANPTSLDWYVAFAKHRQPMQNRQVT
jgi:acetoacetyl-CoA synthetase